VLSVLLHMRILVGRFGLANSSLRVRLDLMTKTGDTLSPSAFALARAMIVAMVRSISIGHAWS